MDDRLRTPMCSMLGVEWPLLSVGFGAGAGPELAAAVSGAGGFGVLGASGMPPDFLAETCRQTAALTDRPFGINLILSDDLEDIDYFTASIAAAADAGASAVVFFWGDTTPFVDGAHERGMNAPPGRVGGGGASGGRRRRRRRHVQGIEAGGHVRGTESIWDLLPATVAAVGSTPVLASGGIGDGSGVARAIELGAQGVSLGTRFVASDEANVHAEYKERIVRSTAADTVYTANLYDIGWPDAPHRTLRNRTFDEWDAAGAPPSGSRPGEGTTIGSRYYPWGVFPWRRYAPGMVTAAFDGDLDLAPLWAGESCSVVNDVKPAAANRP